MRICDRCGPKSGVKAKDRLVFEIEGDEIDLCPECTLEIKEFALKKPKAKKRSLLSLNKEERAIQ